MCLKSIHSTLHSIVLLYIKHVRKSQAQTFNYICIFTQLPADLCLFVSANISARCCLIHKYPFFDRTCLFFEISLLQSVYTVSSSFLSMITLPFSRFTLDLGTAIKIQYIVFYSLYARVASLHLMIIIIKKKQLSTPSQGKIHT